MFDNTTSLYDIRRNMRGLLPVFPLRSSYDNRCTGDGRLVEDSAWISVHGRRNSGCLRSHPQARFRPGCFDRSYRRDGNPCTRCRAPCGSYEGRTPRSGSSRPKQSFPAGLEADSLQKGRAKEIPFLGSLSCPFYFSVLAGSTALKPAFC
jgi:hypothetical protein